MQRTNVRQERKKDVYDNGLKEGNFTDVSVIS